jgi:hypothetical protein
MKYVPGDSVPVVADVAVLPVSADAMSDAPELVPISTTYDVGVPPAVFHEMKIDEPLTVAARPVGADGDVQAAVIVNVTSLDTGPVPHALVALTRAKYVPGTAIVMTADVDVLLDEAVPVAPELVPTSTVYDVGDPDAAAHVNVTVLPLTDAVRFCGEPGDVHGPGGGGGGLETVTVISLDGALVPLPFAARTRTKYVPAATPVVEKLVEVLPVLKFARLARPVDEPASITYPVAAHPVTALFQVTVTDVPLTLEERPVGVPGGPTHGDGPPVTTTVISLEAPPVPALLRPRTRTT